MGQKKNNVELDKDTRILKHRKKEVGKKNHQDSKGTLNHHGVKPEKREHDYMYLHHLDEYGDDLDSEEELKEDTEEDK